jgi:hypothetical protein
VDSITSNLAAIVLVLAGVCLVVMLVLQALQISQLKERLEMLTRGVDGESLESVLGAHLETVYQVGRDLDELTARTAVLESSGRHHFARMGLIRFNPFPDTGGNQSFALALLDESDEGFVVSSLHSRTGTRIYAKGIVAGKADIALSTEETDAMDAARSRRPARPVETPTRFRGGRSSSPTVASADDRDDSAAIEEAPAAEMEPTVAPAPAKAPALAQAPTRGATPARTEAPGKGAAPASTPDRRSSAPTETNSLTVNAKGQTKGTEVAVEDPSAPVVSERTGRKPGRSTSVETTSGSKTDTPGL